MPLVTAAALREDIASGSTAPVYVLLGEDEVEKADVAAQFLELVDEGLRAFNVDRFYGGDVSAAQVIDTAKTLPMMVPRRVVVVLEAEKLLVPKRENKATEEDQKRLTEFIKSPVPESTVVFVCRGLDKRRTLVKLLLKEARVVDCGTIESAEDAERWLKHRAAREHVTFEPAAARALVERAGQDVVRLRGAFERVVLYALGQATITVDDVRQSVPAGAESQVDFGIANAIRDNDAARALSQLTAALDSGVVPVMVLGQLRVAAERLPKPRVRAAVDALFRTDLALKSSGGDPRILLERLVVELCAEAPRKGAPYERRKGAPYDRRGYSA